MFRLARAWLLVAAIAAVACGGGSEGVDAGRDAALNVPPGSCAQPGDEGNENGVGRFCTPRGRECADLPLASLCLAVAAPDDGQWFCTRLCTSDDQCGSNAVCSGDERGRACIPAECAPEPVDAGMDDAGAGDDASVPVDAGDVDAGGVDAGDVDAGDTDAATDDAGAAPDAAAGA